MTTVFLGGGRITTALLAGLKLAGYRGKIVVHDRHAPKLRKLRREFGVGVEPDLQKAVRQADLLVIAVRPQSMADLLPQIKPTRRACTAVSLAAGVQFDRLYSLTSPLLQWARAMPSPVCHTGHGLTALAFGRGFPPGKRRLLRNLFGRVGDVVEVPESQFDVFTVTYSSSHGYHALAALAGAAELLGLNRKTALIAASHALADGIASWRERRTSLARLLHEAATPGGVAAEVMAQMDAAGYNEAIARGLRAGIRRARAIGR